MYIDAVADGVVGSLGVVDPIGLVLPGGTATIEVEVQGVPAPGLNGYNVVLTWSPAANLTLTMANIVDKTGFNRIASSAGVGTASVTYFNLDDPTCTNPGGGAAEGASEAILFTATFTATGVALGPVAIGFDAVPIPPLGAEFALCGGDVVPPAAADGGELGVIGLEGAIQIDAKPTNGSRPCDPVDQAREVQSGETYTVAVCLRQVVNAPGSIELAVNYDSLMSQPTNDAGSPPDNRDGNPDLNDGGGSGAVGVGWDCSIGGVSPPSSGNPALLACSAAGGTTELTQLPGLLAIVEFTAVGPGLQLLSFQASGTAIDGNHCSPAGTVGCSGANIITLPTPPASCEITLQGLLGPGIAAVNMPLIALARIPAGKNNAKLNVRRLDGSLLATQSFTGAPGQSVALGFQASPPAPLTVECVVDGSIEDSEAISLILIDPSGRVYDLATGSSIAGATVVLETDSDAGAGSAWVAMSPATHAGFFEPAINPETTGLNGRYAWDVAPYYPAGTPAATNDYRVVVSAAGCAGTTSAVVTVPPPVTTLDVGLVCADVDGDGLRSVDETNVFATNPTLADTDGNGVADGQEDPDGDALRNRDEVAAGTNPFAVDSDGDGLKDGAEVQSHGTSPLIIDTDADRCPDGVEVGNQGIKKPDNPLDRKDFPDLNRDGKVGLIDVIRLALIWNQQPGYPGWDADTNANGIADGVDRDLNGDGKIGLPDVTVVALAWNRLCP